MPFTLCQKMISVRKTTLCSIVLGTTLLSLTPSQANVSALPPRYVEIAPSQKPDLTCDDIEVGVEVYDTLQRPLKRNKEDKYSLKKMDALGVWFVYDPAYAPALIIAALVKTQEVDAEKTTILFAKYAPDDTEADEKYYIKAFTKSRETALKFLDNDKALVTLSFTYGNTGICKRDYLFVFEK